MAIALQNGEQTIPLVETIETPDKSLAELMYTPGLALAVLRARGLEATQIRGVTPDLEGTDVVVAYDSEDGSQSLTVQCQEFLVPFQLRRTVRSGAYKLAPLDPQQASQLPTIAAWLPLAPGATVTAVYENQHRPAHLVLCEPTADGHKRGRCTCPDAQSQLVTLPTHPALWEAMGQQPICKHWLRASRA